MTYLDTSFLIRALVPGSQEDQTLRRLLRDGEQVAMSAICWTEFRCGPLDPDDAELALRVVGEPVSFGREASDVAAGLFNRGGRRRGSLVDCMVAATAMVDQAPLATSNVADFRRFEPAGLRLLSS